MVLTVVKGSGRMEEKRGEEIRERGSKGREGKAGNGKLGIVGMERERHPYFF